MYCDLLWVKNNVSTLSQVKGKARLEDEKSERRRKDDEAKEKRKKRETLEEKRRKQQEENFRKIRTGASELFQMVKNEKLRKRKCCRSRWSALVSRCQQTATSNRQRWSCQLHHSTSTGFDWSIPTAHAALACSHEIKKKMLFFHCSAVRGSERVEAVTGTRRSTSQTRLEYGPEVDGDSSQLQSPSTGRTRFNARPLPPAWSPTLWNEGVETLSSLKQFDHSQQKGKLLWHSKRCHGNFEEGEEHSGWYPGGGCAGGERGCCNVLCVGEYFLITFTFIRFLLA